MDLSDAELEARLREALTQAAAPVEGTGVQRDAVVRAVARRRRTRWILRGGVAATAAAAAVVLFLLVRPEEGGKVATSDDDSTTTTTTEPTTTTDPTTSSAATSSTTLPTSSSSTPTTAAAPGVGPGTPLSRSGIGPIQVGMTVREAEAAANVTITPGDPIGPGSTCVEAQIEDDEIFLQLAISGAQGEDLREGVIVLVAGDGIRSTVEGVAVGDPVADATATYGPATRTTEYPYIANGQVLVYEAQGHAYGVVTDGATVVALQSGEAARVPSIEGCV